MRIPRYSFRVIIEQDDPQQKRYFGTREQWAATIRDVLQARLHTANVVEVVPTIKRHKRNETVLTAKMPVDPQLLKELLAAPVGTGRIELLPVDGDTVTTESEHQASAVSPATHQIKSTGKRLR